VDLTLNRYRDVADQATGYLFPAFFHGIGPANATFFTAIFPLVGLLAATFLLPEVYRYIEVRHQTAAAARELVGASA
jgi:hypothetical protein